MVTWATVSVTVKVTTPLTLEGPLAAEMIELLLFFASVTVLPLTGLLFPSLSVTVMVEVVEPSAATEVGLALTVELPAVGVPAVHGVGFNGTAANDAVFVLLNLLVVAPTFIAGIAWIAGFKKAGDA